MMIYSWGGAYIARHGPHWVWGSTRGDAIQKVYYLVFSQQLATV